MSFRLNQHIIGVKFIFQESIKGKQFQKNQKLLNFSVFILNLKSGGFYKLLTQNNREM